MTSDEERREVARSLRAAEPEDWYLTISVWGIVQNACGIIDMKTYREKLDRLADLIDPGEPKVRCVAEVKVDGERLEQLVHDAAVELTGIDRDSLLELADEMENNTWYESSFDHRTATLFAHRIRKALKGEL